MNWKLKPTLTTIVIIVAAVIFVFLFSMKAFDTYRNTHTEWHVRSVNFGFAIVHSRDDEREILARNPIKNLRVGDDVIVEGFSYFSSTLPYISNVESETTR